jgi:hypothetical protein
MKLYVVWTPDGNEYFHSRAKSKAIDLAVDMVLNTHERYEAEDREEICNLVTDQRRSSKDLYEALENIDAIRERELIL